MLEEERENLLFHRYWVFERSKRKHNMIPFSSDDLLGKTIEPKQDPLPFLQEKKRISP
jgi:hypothetical protein